MTLNLSGGHCTQVRDNNGIYFKGNSHPIHYGKREMNRAPFRHDCLHLNLANCYIFLSFSFLPLFSKVHTWVDSRPILATVILHWQCNGPKQQKFLFCTWHIRPKRKIQRLLSVIFLNRNFFRPMYTLSHLDSDTMGVHRAARIKIFTYPCPLYQGVPTCTPITGVPKVIAESPRSKFSILVQVCPAKWLWQK